MNVYGQIRIYGNGDSKDFANIENIYGNGKVIK